MLKILTVIAGSLLLASCASSARYQAIDPNISCEALNIKIQKLSDKVAVKQNTAETNRVIDTGSTVAVQGASIAGVPYVGAVFSIGKTLLNHNKKTAAIKAKQAEEELYNLQNLAYEKDCPYTE